MIPISSDATINSALLLICTMSPTAANDIETESYRQSVDTDQSTPQHILESAFVSLIKDVQSLGLIVDIDYSEIFEDTSALFTFLTFMKYLLPNGLYGILKSDTHLKDCVGHIVDGSLGDGETFIQTYLSEIAGLDGQEPLVPHIADMVDKYYTQIGQTDLFTDYMRNMYHLVTSERLVEEADSQSHTTYRDFIRALIIRFSQAVETFAHSAYYTDLCRIQDHLIMDFVSPANFVDYTYIFTTPRDTLPEDLIPSFDKKQYHYQVSTPWCAPYYQVRKIAPTDLNVIAIYCFLYAVNLTHEEYVKQADTVSAIYPSPTVRHTVDALYQD